MFGYPTKKDNGENYIGFIVSLVSLEFEGKCTFFDRKCGLLAMEFIFFILPVSLKDVVRSKAGLFKRLPLGEGEKGR